MSNLRSIALFALFSLMSNTIVAAPPSTEPRYDEGMGMDYSTPWYR